MTIRVETVRRCVFDEIVCPMNEMSFASELRRLRKAADRTQGQVASLVGHAVGSVSNWERGQCLPSKEAARDLDVHLDGEGGLVALWEDESGAAGVPAALRDDITLTTRSRALEVITPALVPGLVQAPPYARHVLTVGRPPTPSAVDPRGHPMESWTQRPGTYGSPPCSPVPWTWSPPRGTGAGGPPVDLVDAGRLAVHLVGPGSRRGYRAVHPHRLAAGGATTWTARGGLVVGPLTWRSSWTWPGRLAESDNSSASLPPPENSEMNKPPESRISDDGFQSRL